MKVKPKIYIGSDYLLGSRYAYVVRFPNGHTRMIGLVNSLTLAQAVSIALEWYVIYKHDEAMAKARGYVEE